MIAVVFRLYQRHRAYVEAQQIAPMTDLQQLYSLQQQHQHPHHHMTLINGVPPIFPSHGAQYAAHPGGQHPVMSADASHYAYPTTQLHPGQPHPGQPQQYSYPQGQYMLAPTVNSHAPLSVPVASAMATF